MTKPFKPPGDPRGAHARLYWEILDSNAWRCLSANDQRAYNTLLRQLRSTNNGDLSLPFSIAKQNGIKSQTTLAACLRALCAVGLLAVTRSGGRTADGRGLATLYRLTDYPTYANPMKNIEASKATNEWKSITTLGLGREAMRRAEARAAEKAAEKTKRALQKMEPAKSISGVDTSKTNPDSGEWGRHPLQKMESAKLVVRPESSMVAQV